MFSKVKTTVVTVLLIAVLGVLGCRTLIDSITPSDINKTSSILVFKKACSSFSSCS